MYFWLPYSNRNGNSSLYGLPSNDWWIPHIPSGPYNEELPFLLEYGNQKYNPYYNTPAFEYMKLSREELEQTRGHMLKLKGYLRTKGIRTQ